MKWRQDEDLAEALEAIGLKATAALARTGRYSDFRSPLATPKMDLVEEILHAPGAADTAARVALARRVSRGEFDG
jgi:hypothetical protein